MSAVALFNPSSVPAHLQSAIVKGDDPFAAGITAGGFPVLSIKGKVFAIIEDKERTMLMKPDEPDEPATSLEVILIAANPNRGRVWYAKGYEDGSTEKPDCYSDDGETPAADSKNKQAKACSACPHSIKGSGQNGKGTACSVSRKVALVAGGDLEKPFMLRVPNASTYSLADYSRSLRGMSPSAVLTKIKFVNEEATPKLEFKALKWLDANQYAKVTELAKTDIVQQMIGLKPMPKAEEPEGLGAPPEHIAKAEEPKVEKPKADKPKADKKTEAPKAEPKAEAKVETPPPAAEDDDQLLNELDDLLGNTDD